MKKLLFVSTILSSLASVSAGAADLLGQKVAMPLPPLPIWTGFYAGLNAGYVAGTNSNAYASSIAQDATILGQPAFGSYYSISAPPYQQIPTGVGVAQSGNLSATQSGFVGGGQVGYNYQSGANLVVGIEADIMGAGVRGRGHRAGVGGAGSTICIDFEGCNAFTNTSTSTDSSTVNAGVDWMGTVRGRLGYLFNPTMLLYATGGLTYGGAYANVTNYAVTNLSSQFSYNAPLAYLPSLSSSSTHTFFGGGSASQTLVGWNAGGGIEWMFMPNWSLKAEGIYWNMGNINVPTSSFAAAPLSGDPSSPLSANNSLMSVGNVRVNYQGIIARMGVNYHFNWGG